MSTALAAMVIVALAVSLATTVFIAVQFSKTLTRSFYLTESVHERSVKHQESLLDRIMSVDYVQLAAWRSSEVGDEGGFVAPEEASQEGVSMKTPGWGSASPVRIRFASEVEGDENPSGVDEVQETLPGVPSR